jgi:amino acid transporter
MDDVSSASKVDKAKMEEPAMPVQAYTPVNDYEVDYEKHGVDRDSNPYPDLKRKLRSRHLQMIAIGEWCLSLAPEKIFPY